MGCSLRRRIALLLTTIAGDDSGMRVEDGFEFIEVSANFPNERTP
jgi:hypothetical protein